MTDPPTDTVPHNGEATPTAPPLISEKDARRIDTTIEQALASVNELDEFARTTPFLPLALQLANELEYVEAVARLNKDIIRARVEAYQRLHPVPI
jgi:hypothetical protein